MQELIKSPFIKFYDNTYDVCEVATPMVFGRKGTTIFYLANAGEHVYINIADADGQELQIGALLETRTDGWHSFDVSDAFSQGELPFEDGQLFRIWFQNVEQDIDMYSQTLQYRKSMDGLSLLTYSCNENAFGIPFATAGPMSVILPINMSAPQYGQTDKVYKKSNGESVVLYAEYTKEWECETEYIPEWWHDQLVAALSCDNIAIESGAIKANVSKKDEYKVDWDNYDQMPDGTKMAKATFKLQSQSTQRNSNY